MNFFEKKHIVTTNELDVYNHVNNVVYVQWIQDIADDHWNVLTEKMDEPDYVWFVIRHEIAYKAQAKLNDEVTITTWVGKTEGVKSVRHVVIKKGETLLVKSATTFCLVDKKSLKPRRITEDIIQILQPPV